MSVETLIAHFIAQSANLEERQNLSPLTRHIQAQAEQQKRIQALRVAQIGALLNLRVGPVYKSTGPDYKRVGLDYKRLRPGYEPIAALGRAALERRPIDS